MFVKPSSKSRQKMSLWSRKSPPAHISVGFLVPNREEAAPHQGGLLGEAERRLHGHDDDEGEEAEHVNQAAAQAGDVGLVEEGADEVAEGQDAQAVVAEVEEEEEAVAFREDAAVPKH